MKFKMLAMVLIVTFALFFGYSCSSTRLSTADCNRVKETAKRVDKMVDDIKSGKYGDVDPKVTTELEAIRNDLCNIWDEGGCGSVAGTCLGQ